MKTFGERRSLVLPPRGGYPNRLTSSVLQFHPTLIGWLLPSPGGRWTSIEPIFQAKPVRSDQFLLSRPPASIGILSILLTGRRSLLFPSVPVIGSSGHATGTAQMLFRSHHSSEARWRFRHGAPMGNKLDLLRMRRVRIRLTLSTRQAANRENEGILAPT